MKAKILIAIGLFVALVVGIGIIIECIKIKAEGYPLEVTDLILLGLLGTYILAVIMKKRTVGKVIVFLWCAAWIVPFIAYVVLRSDICNHLFARLLVWPYWVSQQFFFGRPYFANGMHGVAFGGACTLVIAGLLWVGTNGINRPVKIENGPSEKSSSEQKDEEE
ncbi:MAG: hypothetical protein ACYSR5_01905 [Planctomycetota bacterium]|jgi:hypothetical protein